MRRIAPLFVLLTVLFGQQPRGADAMAARPVELGRIDGLRDILLRDGAEILYGPAGGSVMMLAR